MYQIDDSGVRGGGGVQVEEEGEGKERVISNVGSKGSEFGYSRVFKVGDCSRKYGLNLL